VSACGEPAVPVQQIAEVTSQRALGGTAFHLRLAVASFPPTLPGQFIMIRVTEGWDPLLGRAMAVYRIRRSGSRVILEVVYRVVGRGTTLLSRVGRGRRLEIVGPLGRTFHLPPPGARPILVGGGTGIASLYLLAERLATVRRAPSRREARALDVLIGARTRTEILCRADVAALGARVQISTDDGTQGRRGPVTALLEQVMAREASRGLPFDLVYACGPTPMMEATWRICEHAGVACQVSLEGPMACGIGVCLGCAVPCRREDPDAPLVSPRDRYKLMCTDGPVFDASRLEWGWEEAPGAPAGGRAS
jgi:dihydroorotate dehydrogenase electron transfer subunit